MVTFRSETPSAAARERKSTYGMFSLQRLFTFLSVALVVFPLLAVAAETPEGVLVIHSNQRVTPAAIIIEDTLRKVVPEALQRPVELYSEYLDVEWDSAEGYAAATAAYLRHTC